MVYRIIIFLVLNFGALGIGGFFTGKGVPSEWYSNLNKAPWSPPGWVFGFAWTTIMICFSVYMAYAWTKVSDLKLLMILFALQWVLNIAWNPAFFYFHQVSVALMIISLLTVLVGYFLVAYWSDLKMYSLLIIPYFVWLLIATSLNAYVLIKN
ncbi:TspO/MBR family protein [Lutimonas sp.]|uniref:TspO/MBR family protein n=1 Tax=Lutimonas sp. TaxID=1872403 RepID=UPI003C7964E4